MGEVSKRRKQSSIDVTSKRFRDSGVDSSYEDSQQLYGCAGTIQKIELINFMCHKHLEIDLAHGVNFIIGRNGTGKSALLSAVVVGLGGKASDTNRGYSLKEFIKTDEHSAVIKIVINNDGFNAFQPNVYGEKIIVQRTIGPISSQYKIMCASGNLVSSKHDDLMHILMYLNLQVDNPVALLTQDTARNFLHNTKPTDKYIFFLKATRLEYIQVIYKRVSETLASTRTTQEYRRKRLVLMKEEKCELEKRLKRLQSVEQTRDRLEAAQNELFWANVEQQEQKLEKMEESRVEQENICTRTDEENSLLENKIQTATGNKKSLETQSETILREGKAVSEKCGELKSACEKVNNLRKLKWDEMTSKKEEGNRLKKNIESINKQIDELQATLDSESPQSKEDLVKSLKKLEDDKTDIEAKFKAHQHHLNQLEAALQNDIESQQSLDQELAGINLKISQIQTTLNSLEGKEEGTLRLFGNYVMVLNREIKSACDRGMFSKMPRGPVGSYLKVKDKSWAPAVESIIGGDTLRSYIVNSHQDRKVLYNLINKVTGGSSPTPTVIATKFMDKVYDYQRCSVNCPGYSNVLNMLEVSDFVVTNCLIDLLSIETTLLVESPRAAREMMQDERNVPRNCKKVVTKAGDTYYPDPNYRCYSGDDRTEAKFLQVSVEDAKKGMLTEMVNCKKWAENTISQKAAVGKRIKLHKTEIQASKQLLDQLSKQKLSIKQQVMDLQQSDPIDANQINFWVEEKDTLKKELENTEELLKQAQLEYKDTEESHKEMVHQFNLLREESKKKSRDLDVMVDKCNLLDNKLLKARIALDGGVKKKLEAQKVLKKLENQVSEQKKVVEKCIADALKLTKERIESTRPIPEITEEIKDLKKEIERVEKSEGDPKELGDKFTALKYKCDELSRKINILDECIMKMKSMLRHRKAVYSKCLQLLVTRMQIVFRSLIDRRRFQGGIEIDHNERKLDIRVTLRNPSPGKLAKTGSKRMADSGDPKSLSGGERSFTTVAFILSLWDAVELPFYALDEFDVYMDSANREMTLDLLTCHAEEKKDFQFVFLTPQSINPALQSDRVRIFSLEAHEAQKRAVS